MKKALLVLLVFVFVFSSIQGFVDINKVQAASKPAKPKITVTANDDGKSAVITISKTTNADGYKIVVKRPGTTKYEKLTTVKKNGTAERAYIAKKLNAGEYTFKVKAYAKSGNKKVYGKYSKPVTVKISGSNDTSSKNGTIRVTSFPAGADVYVDGVFSEKTTPCLLSLTPGKHKISLVIPGYEEYTKTVTVKKGKETSLESTILPALPKATVITVNSAKDELLDYDTEQNLTVSDLKDEITLRMALTAIENDKSDKMYRIEFAKDISKLIMNDVIFSSRGNIIINGDGDRDGIPNVTISLINNDIVGGLYFQNGDNIYLCGLRMKGQRLFAFRPSDFATEDISMKNLYVLSCELIDPELIAFCGSCKEYNSSGAVNYENINFCGNTVKNGDVFFAHSGNCDNSITDGIRYCANTLLGNSHMPILPTDCNTWYIYGSDTIQGNGGTPGAFETSEGNIVQNVLISGNNGGGINLHAGGNGNSKNTLKDIVIRNNIIECMYIGPAHSFDEGNVGNTLVTSGNVISNIRIENNTFYSDQDPVYIYVSLLYYDECDPSTTNIVNDNIIRDMYFVGNVIEENPSKNPECFIEKGIDYELTDGVVIALIMDIFDSNPNLSAYDDKKLEYKNNRYEGLVFSGNRKMDPSEYDPYLR